VEHHTKEQLPHSPQVFLWVRISIAKDQPLLLQRVADKSGALVHSDRTLGVACFADHIVRLVGIGCSKRKDFGSLDRILLVVVCSKATAYC
jgi:hypothetical protein